MRHIHNLRHGGALFVACHGSGRAIKQHVHHRHQTGGSIEVRESINPIKKYTDKVKSQIGSGLHQIKPLRFKLQ